MKNWPIHERLYVDIDAGAPGERGRLMHRVKTIELAHKIMGTGVGLMVGSDVISWGYGIIDEIREKRVPCWVNLNSSDSQARLAQDGSFLSELRPEAVTISCLSSVPALAAFKAVQGCEVLGMAALDHMPDDEIASLFNCDPIDAVLALARRACMAGLDGWVASSRCALQIVKMSTAMSMTIKDVRPRWSLGPQDDPKSFLTPDKAFSLGADRILVGEAIANALDPRDAVLRTLEEISKRA